MTKPKPKPAPHAGAIDLHHGSLGYRMLAMLAAGPMARFDIACALASDGGSGYSQGNFSNMMQRYEQLGAVAYTGGVLPSTSGMPIRWQARSHGRSIIAITPRGLAALQGAQRAYRLRHQTSLACGSAAQAAQANRAQAADSGPLCPGASYKPLDTQRHLGAPPGWRPGSQDALQLPSLMSDGLRWLQDAGRAMTGAA